MKKVAIVQRQIPHYRSFFFNSLGDELNKNGIKLKVFAGEVDNSQKFKEGLSNVKYAKKVKNYNFGKSIYWQNILSDLKNYDLVIVEQANSSLINYFLLLKRHFFKKSPKVAFWGHGKTLHRNSYFISSKLKQILLKKVDYWFAYTEMSKKILNESGLEDSKISVVNNSHDVSEISELYNKAISTREIKNKVIFCSRLYENKALEFLIEGCEHARKEINDLNLLIIGDGPDKKKLEKIVRNKYWIEMKGALFGIRKAKTLVDGDIFLMPSHVGLSILDGFAAGLPLLTSDFKNHCPEISYFKNNINGIMTNKNTRDYGEAIIRLLKNEKVLKKMGKEALKTSQKFSLEKMKINFANGIIKALKN